MRESFSYKDNVLGVEAEKGWTSILELIPDSEVPTYVYNLKTIKSRIDAYKSSLSKLKTQIHYAVKSNGSAEVLKCFQSEGTCADVVSQGEFKRALDCGFKGSQIIFSGVAKSRKDILFAIENDAYQINIESLAELRRVCEISKSIDKEARVGFRVNPDIPVDTHPYITTGFRENKFGIGLDQVRKAVKILKESESLVKLTGISAHIGSQIMDVDPLVDSAKALKRLAKELEGQGFKLESIDVGGGVGVDYQSHDESLDIQMIKNYGKKLEELFSDFDGTIVLEPGRSLVGRSGILIAKVEYIKNNGFKDFIIVNTGMHHLMRPSLYKAYHSIVPVRKTGENLEKNFDIVGPICESSDVLGFDRVMEEPKEGDFLAILDAGAYGMTMANEYNLHKLPNEVFV